MDQKDEIIRVLCAALRDILGSEREKWGYRAAANVLDDAKREAAWQALERGEKKIGVIKNAVVTDASRVYS